MYTAYSAKEYVLLWDDIPRTYASFKIETAFKWYIISLSLGMIFFPPKRRTFKGANTLPLITLVKIVIERWIGVGGIRMSYSHC